MPKKVENALKREATKKGLTGESWKAYVYGTLSKMHMMPSQKQKK